MENDLISRKELSAILTTFSKVSDVDPSGIEAALRFIKMVPGLDANSLVQCHECAYQHICGRTIKIMEKREGFENVCAHLHYCEYGTRRAEDGK